MSGYGSNIGEINPKRAETTTVIYGKRYVLSAEWKTE